jgi:hypothetical protein
MSFNDEVVKREMSMKAVRWKCAWLNVVKVIECLPWADEPRGRDIHAKGIYWVCRQPVESYLYRQFVAGLLLSTIMSRKSRLLTLCRHIADEAQHYIGKIV